MALPRLDSKEMSKYLTMALIALQLTACQPTYTVTHIQPMPLDGFGAGTYAGCMRTLARLTLANGTGHLFDVDIASAFCSEVQRSFEEEIREEKVKNV